MRKGGTPKNISSVQRTKMTTVPSETQRLSRNKTCANMLGLSDEFEEKSY